MLESLQLYKGMNVLEIGTASGYNAALLLTIIGGTGNVKTLEIDKEIFLKTKKKLEELNYTIFIA